MKRTLVLLFALASAGTTVVAESPQQAFVKIWKGRTVTVKATLYSLVYNERGKLGTSRNGLREGLMVATPSQGAYLQFDGRQGRDEVREYDPDRLLAAVNSAYEPDVLDVRSYRKLEAVAVRRYDPGVDLQVTDVRVDRDQVRFEFANAGDTDAVTGIRIKWAGSLSKSFSERDVVEGLMQQFVEPKQP